MPAHDPYLRRLVTAVLVTALAGLLLGLVVLGIQILLAAFAGVLFAIFLRALTDLATRYTGLPNGWALTLVVVALLGLLGLGGWLLAPQLADQAEQVSERFPQLVAEVEAFLGQYAWGRWLLDQLQNGEMPGGVGEAAGGFFSGLSRWATYLLTAVFVGLFAAASPQLYQDGLVHLAPLRHRARVRQLLGEIGYTLRRWLIGQLLSMIMIGVSTTLVLVLLGIPLAVLLGLIVGLLGFIPYLGPIIGVVPVALVALLEGPAALVYTLLGYTGVQLVEGYVINPLIHQRMVYLPPVFTIVSQVLLGVVLGPLGIALATPLAAVVLVLSRFYRTDILGDERAEEEA